MSDYLKAWQCIGCGRIEAPQPCVGICQDRKVEFVDASEHREALAELDVLRRKASALEALARRLVGTNPRKDGWEPSYRAMQQQARSTLAAIGSAVTHREINAVQH
jgi:uncharacterized NAD-dependent epimerase/dehydratase family protein